MKLRPREGKGLPKITRLALGRLRVKTLDRVTPNTALPVSCQGSLAPEGQGPRAQEETELEAGQRGLRGVLSLIGVESSQLQP